MPSSGPWGSLERTERELHAAGAEVTIHGVWVALVDQAVIEDSPDVRAAAALAGMATGLAGVG